MSKQLRYNDSSLTEELALPLSPTDSLKAPSRVVASQGRSSVGLEFGIEN